MRAKVNTQAKVGSLPWSNGAMSTKLWHTRGKTIVCVPEIGLHCYGKNESEALFKLFTVLLKYYRQLRVFRKHLGNRGYKHFTLLSKWVTGMENRIQTKIKVRKHNHYTE